MCENKDTLVTTTFPSANRLMDESPRWLIVRGRHADALRVIRRASRWNKVELPPEEQLRAIMKETQAEVEAGLRMRKLVFRHCEVRNGLQGIAERL